MAVKIIRGGSIAPSPQNFMQNEQQVSQPINEGPSLLGRLGFAALKGLELPGEVLNRLNMALGEPSFIQKPLSQDLQERFGYKSEQLEPQNVLERYAQKVATQAPTAAFFGPAQVAQTALSAIPATLSGEVGAPEWLQDLIQLGSEIGMGVASGRLQGIKKVQKKAHDAAVSLVPHAERFGAGSVVKGLTEAARNLETETDAKKVKQVEHILERVRKNFDYMFERPGKYDEFLNPVKAMDIRKKTYALTQKFPSLMEYTKPITDGINTFLAEYGATNPQFFKQLTTRDKLTAARNMKSYIEKGIDLIPLHGSIADFGKNFLKGIFGKTAGEVEKTVRRIAFNDEARKVYFDLVKGITTQNPQVILRNLNNLSAVLEEEPMQERFQVPPSRTSKNVRLIRGEKVR